MIASREQIGAMARIAANRRVGSEVVERELELAGVDGRRCTSGAIGGTAEASARYGIIQRAQREGW